MTNNNMANVMNNHDKSFCQIALSYPNIRIIDSLLPKQVAAFEFNESEFVSWCPLFKANLAELQVNKV